MSMVSDRPHALYRFYGAGGTLLYIGITGELPKRLRRHNDEKPWYGGVANVTVEHYPDRPSVLTAEKRAIIAERPLYNVQHQPDVEPRSTDNEGRKADEEFLEKVIGTILSPVDAYLTRQAAIDRTYTCGSDDECCFENGGCCHHCTLHTSAATAALLDALEEHGPNWAWLTMGVERLLLEGSPPVVAAMRATVAKHLANRKAADNMPEQWADDELNYPVWSMALLGELVHAVAKVLCGPMRAPQDFDDQGAADGKELGGPH